MFKIKNNLKTLSFILGSLALFSGCIAVSAESRSWNSENLDNEDAKWEDIIKNWDSVIEAWDKKRDDLHRKYYEDKYDNRVSYCNKKGECWEEDMFELNYIKNEDKLSFWKGGCDTDVTFLSGEKWKCSNGGQVIDYTDRLGRKWISDNMGQTLKYKDVSGNQWVSENTGQIITFIGANGEKYEVSNYGQTVEHIDSEGNTWSGSDDDDVDDMR